MAPPGAGPNFTRFAGEVDSAIEAPYSADNHDQLGEVGEGPDHLHESDNGQDLTTPERAGLRERVSGLVGKVKGMFGLFNHSHDHDHHHHDHSDHHHNSGAETHEELSGGINKRKIYGHAAGATALLGTTEVAWEAWKHHKGLPVSSVVSLDAEHNLALDSFYYLSLAGKEAKRRVGRALGKVVAPLALVVGGTASVGNAAYNALSGNLATPELSLAGMGSPLLAAAGNIAITGYVLASTRPSKHPDDIEGREHAKIDRNQAVGKVLGGAIDQRIDVAAGLLYGYKDAMLGVRRAVREIRGAGVSAWAGRKAEEARNYTVRTVRNVLTKENETGERKIRRGAVTAAALGAFATAALYYKYGMSESGSKLSGSFDGLDVPDDPSLNTDTPDTAPNQPLPPQEVMPQDIQVQVDTWTGEYDTQTGLYDGTVSDSVAEAAGFNAEQHPKAVREFNDLVEGVLTDNGLTWDTAEEVRPGHPIEISGERLQDFWDSSEHFTTDQEIAAAWQESQRLSQMMLDGELADDLTTLVA